jgi:hypothetical protein
VPGERKYKSGGLVQAVVPHADLESIQLLQRQECQYQQIRQSIGELQECALVEIVGCLHREFA